MNRFAAARAGFAALLLVFAAQEAASAAAKKAPAPAAFTAGEKAALRALIAAMPKDGSPAVLDIGNDANYRLYQTLLRQEGLTDKNRPQLYHSLKVLHERQRAQKASGHNVSASGSGTDTVPPYSTYQVVDLSTNDWKSMDATAYSSVDGGTYYTQITVNLLDEQYDSFAKGDGESYDDGKNFAVLTDKGDNPEPEKGKLVTGMATYYIHYKDGAEATLYSGLAGAFLPKKITNTAPVITTTTPMNPWIVVCLNRAHPDPDNPMPCNYGPYQQSTNDIRLVVPTSGTIDYDGKIDTDPTTGKPVLSTVQLTMAGVDTGAACTIANATQQLTDNASVTNNGETLQWSLNPADFGKVCYQNNEKYVYTLALGVTIDGGGVPIIATITNSTRVSPSASALVIPPIQVQWGCIVEGTDVLMADGSMRKIEKIKQGDYVMGPGKKSLKVFSTTIGYDVDFVRLEDKAGDKLVVTPAHPIYLPSGAVMADAVKAGEKIMRADGTWSPLTKVARESGTKHNVYNLFLNPQTAKPPKQSYPPKFFAGGIMVGDGDVQHKLVTAHQTPADIRAALPADLRLDYDNYLKEKRAAR
jgi:hypothetical protein